MIRFLTYSNDNMTRSRMLCADSARKHGADMVYEYEPNNIDRELYVNNKNILDAKFAVNYEPSPRPCDGYWLWKSYFVNKVMNGAEEGDVVVYVDAGVEVIDNLNHIVNAMDQDIFLFTNGLQHAHWCKADVMQAINGAQIDASVQQVQASAIFIRVNEVTRRFVKEWLLWCQMPGMITDELSVLPNHPEFACHRYDQAILCCLAVKYGYRTHWWPDARWFSSQRYRWPGDQYPLMFIHHRRRNEEY